MPQSNLKSEGIGKAALLAVPAISQRSNVAHFLRELIISGELKPGNQVKQNEIAEAFNCSPGPVREAMRDLESEGLLEHLPNRGVFVTSISGDEFLQMLLPVRLVMEQFALRNARDKFTPYVINELQDQIKQMRAGAKLKNLRMVKDADIKFHTITMEVAASTQTLNLWKGVLSRVRLEFYSYGRIPSLTKQAPQHAALLDAFLTGSPSKVDEMLARHIIGPFILESQKKPVGRTFR